MLPPGTKWLDTCDPSGRDQETRPAFPRARGTVPRRPAGPGTATGQRPTRRALRPRRAGRWPVAVPGPAGPQGTVLRGRGNAGRVS